MEFNVKELVLCSQKARVSERSECSIGIVTSETIKQIHDIMLAGWRFKVRGIVNAIGILCSPVALVLNDYI